MPEQSKRAFDRVWGRIEVDTLKRIVKIFGGKSTWRKDECIAFLLAAFNDPARIQSVVNLLGQHEYNILAFIKSMGGEMESGLLKMAMYASGTRMPGARYGYLDPFDDALQKFLRSGLVMNRTEYGSPAQLHSYNVTTDKLYSDERVLEHVGEPRFAPVTLDVHPEPPAVSARPPHLITMQVISILNMIEASHGLKLTKSREVRVAELRKIAKGLDYKNDSLVEGSFSLPNAAAFMVGVLRESGLLHVKGDVLIPSALADTFINLSSADQVRLLVNGVINTTSWQETDRFHYGYYSRNVSLARLALLIFLKCLPMEQDGVVRVDDLDTALFQRIGEHFKLLSFAPRYYSYHHDPKAEQQKYALWLAEQREAWMRVERIWLSEAFKTWLYFLGLVGLEMDQDTPVTMRLTGLGLAVLHPDQQHPSPDPKPAPENGQSAWVVQPNFDVIAYLDHLPTSYLSFLERNAERISASDHVAQYRITRDSVYRGLESGSTVENILDTWQRGSGKDLPQNIRVEILEWAALREQMVLYRRTDLAEFPNGEARQAAIDRGIPGRPVGDRFLLITEPLSKAQVKLFYSTLDYARPPQRSLIIEEDGVVIVNSDHSDLVLAARLSEWTDIDEAGNPRITQASIRRAITAGQTINSFFKILEERLARMLPPIIQVTLRAWAGEQIDLTLGNVLVLYAPSPDISYAIQNSALLRPYLRGVLAPGYFLVHREQAQALQAQLAAFGLGVDLEEIADLPERTLTRDRKFI